MPRTLTALLPALAVLALIPSSAAAAGARPCAGADPENGITAVRVVRISCPAGLAVAVRTNSVKCFLNGDRCTHRFRGRRWTCTLKGEGTRVRCRSGRKVVRYRLG